MFYGGNFQSYSWHCYGKSCYLQYWRHNDDMLKCYGAGRIPPTRGWQIPRHQHPLFHEIILIVQGELHTDICGQRLIGTPGDMLFYPRDEPHAEFAGGHKPLETLFFSFSDPDLNVADWPLVRQDRTGHAIQAVRWLLDIVGTGGPDQLPVVRLVEMILMELRRQAMPDTPVARAIRHIHYHMAEPLTLDDLAEAAGMSRFHFARSFQRATGQPPMEYLRARRVEAARHFLTTSTLPLRAIAPQVGLVDEAHLSRVFKRTTGLSPGEVRRKM